MGLFAEAAPGCQHSFSVPCENTIDYPAQGLSRQSFRIENASPIRTMMKYVVISYFSARTGGFGVIAKLGKHQSRHHDPAWRDRKKSTENANRLNKIWANSCDTKNGDFIYCTSAINEGTRVILQASIQAKDGSVESSVAGFSVLAQPRVIVRQRRQEARCD